LPHQPAQPDALKYSEHIMVYKNSLIRRSTLAVLSVSLLSMSVAACSSSQDDEKNVAALDEKLAGKGSDPSMNGALDDRILVDPAMADSSNANMVKAPDQPLDGSVPPDTNPDGPIASAEELNGAKLMRAPKPTVVNGGDCRNCNGSSGQTLESLAAEQGAKRGKGTCEAKLQYGAGWAARMPTEFPVYPNGRVKEAAGVEGGICDIRVVSFSTSASMQSVADYYYTRARRSGFTADYELRDGEHVMGGTRDNDSGAYVITLNPLPGGGTSVEIVANNGR
jgi:hypothetical protein